MIVDDILQYLKRASILPVGRDKKPLIPWKKFQSRKPTEDEVREWFKKFPEMNIGIITGKISDLIVVDVEKGGSVDNLPDTLIVKTGGGGWHYYYKYTEGINNKTRIKDLIDIRGDGGYVIAPPSIHSSGVKYEWVNHKMPSLFPKYLFGFKNNEDWAEISSGVSEGQRNETASKYIGKLMRVFSQDTWETTVWETARIWNNRNIPALPEGELRSVYESISRRAIKNDRKIEHKAQGIVNFIPFTKVLQDGIDILLTTKEKDIVSFGYDWLDDKLTGLFPGELVVVGGESGTGKTTFATNIIYKASKNRKCVVFALEDRLDDYAIKRLYFEVGKIRQERGQKNYKWNDYRKNTISREQIEEELSKASNNLKNNDIYFADVKQQMNISLLEELIEEQVNNGVSLFLIDHLHYFDLLQGNANKSDYIESLMVRLKTLQNRTGARIILVVHYKKLDGRKPRLDSFKDSIAIVQNANYVINIWRERDSVDEINKYKTTFYIPKSRNPNGEGIIEVEFDPNTNDYKSYQGWQLVDLPKEKQQSSFNNY